MKYILTGIGFVIINIFSYLITLPKINPFSIVGGLLGCLMIFIGIFVINKETP